MAFEAGQSAVILPVLDAEPLVSGWRATWDPASAMGVPGHLTVCFPFGPISQVTDHDRAALASLALAVGPLALEFSRCERFPEVLYLAPEPDTALRQLTLDLWKLWPQWPPYGGEFADPIPHLTVTVHAPVEVMDAVERDLAGRLPLHTVITEVWLIVCDGKRWNVDQRFPLGT